MVSVVPMPAALGKLQSIPKPSYTITSAVITKGETMPNLSNTLHELRAERSQAQLHVEKLDKAISVIESLNGSGTSGNAIQPKRIISAASRRKMALAQKARWARAGKELKPLVAPTSSSSAKRIMSASARRKIAASQKARWAKVRAEQKKAA
jgi:hypothetical protein